MKSKLCKLAVFYVVPALISSLFIACTVPTDKAMSYPTEIVDQLGRTVKLDRTPQRIISLAPSNTEVLFALGLADKLVGVTEYCDYPEAAQEKPKVGGFSTVDIERVVEIQPDLILATEYHKEEVVPALERVGLPVVCLNPTNLDEILEAITLAGKCTGKENEASQLVTEMEKRINAITEKTSGLSAPARPRVFYIVYRDPLMTVGSDTITHELIVKAGGINIAQDLTGDYPTIGLEAVSAANPQVIVANYGHGTVEDLPLQFALTEPRLSDVDARVNNQVYGIDTDLGSRPGLRIIDGLELLAKMIHPEIFGPVE